MIKNMVTNFRTIRQSIGDDPEVDQLLGELYKKLAGKQEQLQANARATVQAVRHALTVSPQ